MDTDGAAAAWRSAVINRRVGFCMPKPNLPKELAAQIISAQNTVRKKRLTISYAALALERAQEIVDEYENDLSAFEDRHSKENGWNPYNVEAHIRANRKRAEEIRSQWETLFDKLVQSEKRLDQIEAKALIASRKQSAKGECVPWPRKVKKWHLFREEYESAKLRSNDRCDSDEEASSETF